MDQLPGIELQMDTVVLSFDTRVLGIQTPVLGLVRKHLTQKLLPEAPHLAIIHSFIQERLYFVMSNMGNFTKMFQIFLYFKTYPHSVDVVEDATKRKIKTPRSSYLLRDLKKGGLRTIYCSRKFSLTNKQSNDSLLHFFSILATIYFN